MEEIRELVDGALEQLDMAFREYPYDGDQLQALFEQLMYQLSESISGLDAGMTPLLSGESAAVKAEVGRHNLQLLRRRLLRYRESGYQSTGFSPDKAYLNRIDEACNELRRQVADMGLVDRLRTELIDKLDELQEIGRGEAPAVVKWDQLRPTLVWLSGKPAAVGFLLLPLLLLILKGEAHD